MEFVDICVLCLTFIFFVLWWRYWSTGGGSRHKNLPPSPPRWPIIGNAIQLITYRKHFIFLINDLRKIYGPIFTMQMGFRTVIIVADAKLAHEALVQRGALFASRPSDSQIRSMFNFRKCSMLSSEYGAYWRNLRRNFVTELISPARVKQYAWIRKWALENLMAKIKSDALEHGSVVELIGICRFTACGILICLCLGAKFSEEQIVNIDRILKRVMWIISPRLINFFPFLTPLFYRTFKEAKQIREEELECLIPLIKNRRAFVEKGESPNAEMMSPIGAAYVDSLFGLQPAGSQNAPFGEEECVTLCQEVITAGTETTATSVQWAMFHLVTDQEIQEKLYKEIVECVGKDGEIQDEDVEKMPYLTAVVKETFRRHPPGHFLLPHAAIEDTELGGYKIPAGVQLEFYSAFTRDEDLWSDPTEFRPERFLEGDGVGVDILGTREVKMLPFGAGRRICPAWNLGILHVSLMVARMVQAYKWTPVPGAPPDPTEGYAFTIVMKTPLKAVVTPRKID